jgi:HEAT repeat protein
MDAPEPEDDPLDGAAFERRVEAASSAFRGDVGVARRRLVDADARVRAAAFGALVQLGAVRADDVARALHDPDPVVRRRTCELAANAPAADYTLLLADPDPSVVEAASYAIGEIGDRSALIALSDVATAHRDPLCREAAVAALGALGDPDGKAPVLAALADAVAIRRRAVVALAAFEGADVDAALRACLSDRDWQTRQAAAEILGSSEDEPR